MTDTVKPETVPEDVRKLAEQYRHEYLQSADGSQGLTGAIAYAILADRAARPDTGLLREAATHRHVKRGSEYVLIGIGKMQTINWAPIVGDAPDDFSSVDDREVAIYRSTEDGLLWVRPREEFDARFDALAAIKEAGK